MCRYVSWNDDLLCVAFTSIAGMRSGQTIEGGLRFKGKQEVWKDVWMERN